MQAARNPGIKKSRSFGIPELRIHIFIQCSFGLKPGVFGQWFCRRYIQLGVRRDSYVFYIKKLFRRTPRLICFFVTNCLGVHYRSHRRSAEIQWRSAVAEVSGGQRRPAEDRRGQRRTAGGSAEVSFSEIP